MSTKQRIDKPDSFILPYNRDEAIRQYVYVSILPYFKPGTYYLTDENVVKLRQDKISFLKVFRNILEPYRGLYEYKGIHASRTKNDKIISIVVQYVCYGFNCDNILCNHDVDVVQFVDFYPILKTSKKCGNYMNRRMGLVDSLGKYKSLQKQQNIEKPGIIPEPLPLFRIELREAAAIDARDAYLDSEGLYYTFFPENIEQSKVRFAQKMNQRKLRIFSEEKNVKSVDGRFYDDSGLANSKKQATDSEESDNSTEETLPANKRSKLIQLEQDNKRKDEEIKELKNLIFHLEDRVDELEKKSDPL